MRVKRHLNGLRLTDWIAVGLLLVYVAAFSRLTIRQHDAFRTSALDLAKFDQMIWNAAQGRRPFSTITRQSVLQGHFSPGLALYAPLYWVWPDIRLLFIVQSICLGGAGFLIYWYFREDAAWLGLAVYMAYSLHPSLHQVNLVEFRRITAGVLAGSFSMYQMLKRRYGWMLFGLLAALVCKENMALLAIGVGTYVSLGHRSLRVGLPVVTLGVAWLVLVPLVAVPAFGGTYRATGNYLSYLGDSPKDMVGTLLQNPGALRQFALRPERWRAVLELCWPTGFMFLLAPEITAFTVPFLGYLLVSSSKTMGRLEAWYPSAILPMLYWAVGFGLSRLRDSWRIGALTALLVTGTAGYVTLSEIRPEQWAHLDRFEVTDHHRSVAVALQQIPADATVAAQDPLVPHLSHRERVYLFPWAPKGLAPDYVVLDRQMKTYPVKMPTYRTLFYNLLAGTEYEISEQIGSFFLFRYTGDVKPGLERTAQFGGFFTLTGFSIAVAPPGEAFGPILEQRPPGSTVRVSLFWSVDRPVEQNYTVFVHAMNDEGQLVAQHDGWPADAHRPTSVLPANAALRDVHYLTFPQSTREEVVLHVGLYDAAGQRLLTQEGEEFIALGLTD